MLSPPYVLRVGDRLSVSRSARLVLRFPGGDRYVLQRGEAALVCSALALDPDRPPRHVLALDLRAGRASVRVTSVPALIETANALAVGHHQRTLFTVRFRPRHGTSVVAGGPMAPVELISLQDQRELRIHVRPSQVGLLNARGLRLDSWPFALTRGQRVARLSDQLAPFQDDGSPCSTGCHAPGAPGWPLRPFHRQHPLRAGLNELRPSGLHLGFDIQARDHQRVYAMQSGTARIVKSGGPDIGVVQVGQFVYWHLDLSVSNGQFVRAYRTPLGRIHSGFGHVHLSEVAGGEMLNVLRPGGRMLAPWSDTEPPIIGAPRIYPDGRVVVDAFDPQSFVTRTTYETPVLAPAALAYRLFDAGGQAIGGLHWALRSTHHLPDGLQRVIFAPGAANPGFSCFALRRVCVPAWRYRLAGGLAPPLPLTALGPGRFRLTIYAFDYAGNVRARDVWLGSGRAITAAVPVPGPGSLAARFDP